MSPSSKRADNISSACNLLQARGLGLLQAKFEALKRKLEAEGLFDPARKRPLPAISETHRHRHVAERRGDPRHAQCAATPRAPAGDPDQSGARAGHGRRGGNCGRDSRTGPAGPIAWQPLDLIVIARGGGSIEDLWEFNEEIVARAIFDSPIPVVSAVGHEIDFTIADFVADLRAPTPSAAAELIVPDSADLLRRIDELSVSLERNLRNFLSHARTKLRNLSEKALTRDLAARMRDAQQQLDLVRETLGRLLERSLADARAGLLLRARALQARNVPREIEAGRERLASLQRRLPALPARLMRTVQERLQRTTAVLRVLGPEETLRRGYSITTTEAGQIISSAGDARPGTRITTRVIDGTFESEVLSPAAVP